MLQQHWCTRCEPLWKTRLNSRAGNPPCGPKGRSSGLEIKAPLVLSNLVVGFVGMRNSVPAETEIQRQSVSCTPVVLNVGSWRNVIPLTSGFDDLLATPLV